VVQKRTTLSLSALDVWVYTVDRELWTVNSPGDAAMMLYLIWQCLKCGYALVAKDPPDKCPDCGAPREEFVLIEED
jgi:rubrerythrin